MSSNLLCYTRTVNSQVYIIKLCFNGLISCELKDRLDILVNKCLSDKALEKWYSDHKESNLKDYATEFFLESFNNNPSRDFLSLIDEFDITCTNFYITKEEPKNKQYKTISEDFSEDLWK